MSRTLALIVVAAVAVAALPPAYGAAHQAKWSSDGYAVSATGQVFLIEVMWGGQCRPYFTVELSTTAGDLVELRSFNGVQTLLDQPSFSQVETFQVTLGSTTAGLTFDGRGYQRWYLDGSSMSQVLVGHYRDLTYVAASVSEAWTFC